MDEKLRKLKKSPSQPAFKDVIFSHDLKERITTSIHDERETDEEIIFSILQLLAHRKSGLVLLGGLRARGVKRFENSEGNLYLLLHQLEKKQYIIGSWSENGEKEYVLSSSGKKAIQRAEQGHVNALGNVREVMKGAFTH
ncbi:helix-turn-helix transcriptional regulator [Cytobacillus horneckiae]|uniref:helix-turn-helix transcriptional regulator n=1 Tax=Cytobacillus horneckiae TaxID=549687 RepID=UPI00204022BC|nr:helix-turn-helix transcriptional regulator [Cytobacillus horneckiae]MCM3176546.1 helix-turn-helix transcriptional regulator [Cytobacillus horneckiae]